MSVSPPPPRRLERSRTNRVVGGVCGGVAAYANIDPTLVRILTVVVSLSTGVPIILYLIALFALPEEGEPPPQHPPVGGGWTYDPYPYQPGQSAPPSYGPGPGAQTGPHQYGVPPSDDESTVWGPGGAPWHQPPPTSWQQPPTARPGADGEQRR